MSMKCNCGSDDKLISKDGAIVRKADNMPHICLGQTKPTQFLNEKPQQKTNESLTKEFDNFCAENHPRLKAFEKWVLDHDKESATNGQRLGLIMNQLNNQWIQEKVLNK